MRNRYASRAALVLVTMLLTTWLQPLSLLQALAQQSGGCQTFKETGKTVCGRFLQYWQQNGGLAQQGYPLTNEFQEVSDLDGKTYTVQYFERAVFEKHPENKAPYDVLLSQLGTFRFKAKYPGGDPSVGGGQQPQPTATVPPAPTQPPVARGPKLELVDYSVYKAEYSGKRVVGYVRNSGTVDLSRVQVVATFKNAAGGIIGTQTDDCSCVLRPNDFFPFSMGQSSSDPEFASVDFQLASQSATDSDRRFYYNAFAVSDVNVVPPAGYNNLKVLGTVKNTGDGIAYLAHVRVLILDGGGKTVDVDDAYTELDELGPGVSSPFKVEFSHATTAPTVKVAVYSHRK